MFYQLWKQKLSKQKGTTNFKSWRDLRSEEHKQVPRKYDLTLRLLSFTDLQILNLRVNVCCTFLKMQLGTSGYPRYNFVFLTSTSLLQRTRVALVMEFNKSRSARQNLTVIRDEGGTRTLNLQLLATLCYHSQQTMFLNSLLHSLRSLRRLLL